MTSVRRVFANVVAAVAASAVLGSIVGNHPMIADATVITLSSGLEVFMPDTMRSVNMEKRPTSGDKDEAPALVMILHGIGGAPLLH